MNRPTSFTSLNDLLQQRANEPRGKWIFLRNRGREEQVLSYRELAHRAAVVANALGKANCGVGDRVVLLFQTGSAFLEAFFGCSFSGAVAVPLNPPRPNRKKERYQAVLEDAQCNYILTDRITAKTLRGTLPEGLCLLVVEDLADEPLTSIYQATPNDLAFLQYTSGSTGTPKGVMISHGNLLANLEVIRGSGELGNDVYVNWLPFFHDMGLIFTLLGPLYTNDLSVHLTPSEFMQRPLTWLKAIDHYRGTVCGGPNFAFEQCIRRVSAEQIAALDLSCWRAAFTGAEPIRAETLERFAETFAPAKFQPQFFYPCYGLAEATLMVSGGNMAETYRVKRLDRKALNDHRVLEAADGASFVDCGLPRPGFDLRIVDPTTQTALPEGEVGEIWVAGDSVARGYWQRNEATVTTFQNQLRDEESQAFYLATGDLGFLSEGRLFVSGRLKDLIIIRGRNYVPSDIETTAAQVDRKLHIDGAAAFTVEENGQERLIVVQELVRGHQQDIEWEAAGEAMRRAISEQQELQLHEVVFLKQGALPKTSSGKVQRSTCRKLYLENQLPALHYWPQRETQQACKAPPAELKTWLKLKVAERLGIEPETIDEGQPLALYGMDSPTALMILGELETHVDRELSPTLVYEYPTIRDLVGYLNGEQPTAKVTQQTQQEPIAVVGAGCRFPGANNLEAFWQLLLEGKDAITEVPAERWSVDDHYDPQPQTADKMITRYGGFIDGIDQFDAKLFDITPQEAENMDPQQRHLLEVTWQAMDHTGFGVEHFRGSQTGVFVGVARSDYSALQVNREGGRNAYAGIGSATSIAANRISYTFDLRGPSFAVDTACSSALVAIDRACRSLEQGECETALAGAVNCILTPELTTALSQAGMMSPDGRCFAFDARANGYVRAEGCAMVVLKPLSKAIRDGNHIMGVVKGTAVNQDGRGNGLTAPNGRAQKEVLRNALARANAIPNQISYIEAHGTGTALGDPIEMDALKDVLATDREAQNPCWLGSVKTNIGHTETVAGLAGFLKVLLSMREQRIPKQLHFQSLNPHIKLDGVPLRIATEDQAWTRSEKPRLAGISSFGIGGTNAHVVVAEAPVVEAPQTPDGLTIISLSAETRESLSQAESQLTQALLTETVSVAEVATTLEQGRRVFRHRAAWLADSQASAAKPDQVIYGEVSKQANLAFLFPGQGSQYPGMGAALYSSEPVYRQTVDQCADILKPHLDLDLRCLLTEAYMDQANAQALMTQTRIAQPALFVVSYAIAQVWQARGLQPNAMMGHSIGEFVAACISGVFSLEAALVLVARRGQLMQSMPAGAMLAVPLPEAELLPLLGQELDLAAINGSRRCVVSGPDHDIDAFSQRLKAQGVVSRRLVTSHAFHSRMMEPILATFQAAVAQASPQAPNQPFISSLTGDWITAEQAEDPAYWSNQLRGCVRFAPGVKVLAQKATSFLEVGPGETLCKLGGSILGRSKDVALINTLPGPKKVGSDARSLQGAAAKLWVHGVQLTLNPAPSRKRVALPGLVMSSQTFWVPRGQEKAVPKGSTRLKDIKDWFSIPVWQQTPPAPAQSWQSGGTLLLHDDSEAADHLQQQLLQNGDRVVCVRIGEAFGGSEDAFTVNPRNPQDYRALMARLTEESFTINRIVHCWLLRAENESAAQVLETGFFSCIYLLQALKSHKLRFLAVTRHVYAVDRFDEQHAEKATILGPITVMRREFPDIEAGHLDLAFDTQPEEASSHMLQSLQAEILPATEAARGNARWQRHFKSVAIPKHKTPAPLRTNGAYLLTGGLGAVGRAIALHLAQSVQAKLVLVGRSEMPKREDWEQFPETNDAEMCARIEAIRQMKAAGSEVWCLQADVTCEDSMRHLVTQAKLHVGAIDGVIHAAGIPGDGMICLKDEAQARKVLAPKVTGSLVLERVFQDQQPDFIVYCSSVFALAGEFGQVDYCAANTFQDHLAETLDRPQSRRISISWGAWRDGGMAARMNLSPALRDIHQRQLRLGLSAAEGGEAFGRAIAYGHNRIAICTQDLETMLQAYEAITAQTQQITLPVTKRERTSEKPFQAPQGEIESKIAAIWSELTGVEPVGRDDHFFELGGDSLVATQMFSQVEAALGAAPDMALFYENPTVAGIAAQFESGETQVATQIVRVSRNAPLPLSLAQHRLWFDSQRRGATTLYNLPGRVTLHGQLDRKGFEAGFMQVVAKHESLRTRFIEKEGQPLQVIEAQSEHGMIFTDLSDSENVAQALMQIQQAEAKHLFQLDKLPLYRVHLVCLAPNHHELFINMHHIIFDGWSETVLLKDWMAAYQHPDQRLSSLQVQYADYATWQRDQLDSQTMREQQAWWLSQLQGAPRLLLPKDKEGARPESQHRVSLTSEQVARVRTFAAQQQQTAYSLAMAAYLLTLHSRTGQRDLVLGLDFANRQSSALQEMIGFFVNPMPLRVQVKGEDCLRDFAQRLRQQMIAAEQRQAVPFNQLVEQLPSDTREPLPLIQSIFVQQNVDFQTVQQGELTWSLHRDAPPCKFETAIFVTEHERGISLLFTSGEGVFEPKSLAQIANETVNMLNRLVAKPNQPVTEISDPTNTKKPKKALPAALRKRQKLGG